MESKRIGIVGLGLIGGSFAKAARAAADCAVYGADTDAAVLSAAVASGAVDGPLDGAALASVDLLVLALYPRECAEWLRAAPTPMRWSDGREVLLFACKPTDAAGAP